jgi:hypothetical protein
MQSADALLAQSPEARQILDAATSQPAPAGWHVWPLRRDRVGRSVLGWAAASLFGFALFIPITLATVPGNFSAGVGLAIFTAFIEVMLGVVAFGSLSVLWTDLYRYLRADRYLLVMTPTDFLMVEPRRIVHVPMDAVAHVTLKGVDISGLPPDEQARLRGTPPPTPSRTRGPAWSTWGFGLRVRREPKRAPSLAFLDTRTRREVVVSTDDSFDVLSTLERVLSAYARGDEFVEA